MIAVEVFLNGKKLTVAGAEDLCVLSATITATGKLGKISGGTKSEKEKADIHLRVGGLTSRPEPQEDEHLTWVNGRALRVGDKVEVRIVETKKPHAHKKTSSAGGNTKALSEKRWFETAKKEYFRLREKYESTER